MAGACFNPRSGEPEEIAKMHYSLGLMMLVLLMVR